MLGTPEEAEDAVQHTFMAAYRELVGTDKPIHLRPGSTRSPATAASPMLRARREQPPRRSRSRRPTAWPPTSSAADLRDLLPTCTRCPSEQRAALVLSELGDLSHDEIGAVLGVPEGQGEGARVPGAHR